MGIEEGISGRKVYLDTNIFIYAYEGYPAYIQLVQVLFDAIDQGKYRAYTSELTLAELLVKPYSEQNAELADMYLDKIQAAGSLSMVPVSRSVLIAAAQMRAQYGPQVKLPDAIHLASAIIQGCTTFISNDRRLKLVKDITILVLDEIRNQ